MKNRPVMSTTPKSINVSNNNKIAITRQSIPKPCCKALRKRGPGRTTTKQFHCYRTAESRYRTLLSSAFQRTTTSRRCRLSHHQLHSPECTVASEAWFSADALASGSQLRPRRRAELRVQRAIGGGPVGREDDSSRRLMSVPINCLQEMIASLPSAL